MSTVIEVGRKKIANQAGAGTPPVKKKDGLTFRLKDRELAYKLGMVLEDRRQAAWEYLEPLIREDVEIAFAALVEKMNQKARGATQESAARKKAE